MKTSVLKKIALSAGITFLVLLAILTVHIYVVTRPGKADMNTRIMARVDIKNPTTQDDAKEYTTWFYSQKGVDHVLCNPKTDILIFTYAPLKADANKIIRDFGTRFKISAVRFMPTPEQMASGCPVATNSFAFKAATFFKHIF